MKRINPNTGKPFKRGDTREDGMVFAAYQLNAKLPSDPQYFYENWRTREDFEQVKAAGNNQVKAFHAQRRKQAVNSSANKRINPATGKYFKYGDHNSDGDKVFASYNYTMVNEDGCFHEVWYTLAGFENNKERVRKWTDENTFTSSLSRAKRRARAKGLPFQINKEYLEAIFPSDNRCPVFGTEFERGGEAHERDNSPSLDRIIPELGYVEGNVVWICNRANILKRDATWEELHRVAEWLKSVTPE
jgi:hypothetical protein